VEKPSKLLKGLLNSVGKGVDNFIYNSSGFVDKLAKGANDHFITRFSTLDLGIKPIVD